jgi:hypothetical protein
MHGALSPRRPHGMRHATMKRHAAHRAGSVLVALALLVAAAGPGPRIDTGCVSCAPGCPMHAPRVGCHHSKEASCHRGARATGVRSACRHAEAATTPGTSGLRAVMPAHVASHAVPAVRRTDRPVQILVTQHLPEPPTEPPRAPVLPS